jgi:hypothetical protein
MTAQMAEDIAKQNNGALDDLTMIKTMADHAIEEASAEDREGLSRL